MMKSVEGKKPLLCNTGKNDENDSKKGISYDFRF